LSKREQENKMTTTYTIKCTSRMSKGMELNGNVLSGDTFGAKEYIKAHWDGKWDASSKVWIVNPEKVFSTIKEQAWGFTKVLSISEAAPALATTTRTHGVNGWCNKCHSYCYGDCDAH